MSARHLQRLERQLVALTARVPVLRPILPILRGRPAMILRVPLGLFFVAGGFLAILPFFGLWMIPLGLILLAVDLPILRPVVATSLVRLRRRWALWWRKARMSNQD